MTLKLTPTTNDAVKSGNGVVTPLPTNFFAYVTEPNLVPQRVVEAHEPLSGEPWTPASANAPAQGQVPQAAPAAEPQPLKIAIIGTAPSSRGLAPFGDPSWKIWACSAGNQHAVPRVDAWFEIHSNLLWPENESFGKPYLEWLNKQTFPIYMQDNKLVERATAFPKDELIEEFGRYFFTSSFSWMLAFAIKQNPQEIGLWGVDMASRDEYILQRAGGHFFLQEARRRGIKVTLPNESDLLQPPPLYGFDDSTPFLRKINVREKELKDRLAGMTQQRDQLTGSITYLQGALEDIDYIKSIWGGAQTHGS